MPSQIIKSLSERHKQAARLLHASHQPKDIIDKLGIRKDTWKVWRRSPVFKEYLTKLGQQSEKQLAVELSGSTVKSAIDIIENKSDVAARLLTGMLDPEYFNTLTFTQKRQLIKDVFEYSGVSRKNDVSGGGPNMQIVINASQLQSAKKTADDLDPDDFIEINKDGSPVSKRKVDDDD